MLAHGRDQKPMVTASEGHYGDSGRSSNLHFFLQYITSILPAGGIRAAERGGCLLRSVYLLGLLVRAKPQEEQGHTPASYPRAIPRSLESTDRGELHLSRNLTTSKCINGKNNEN